MAAAHGKNGSITLAASAMLPLTEWTINTTTPLADATGMGDTGRTYAAGIPESTISGTVIFNEDNAPQATMRAGASLAAVIYPHGNSAGNAKFTGTVVVESHEITGTLDDMVRMTFSSKGPLVESVV